MESTLSSEAKLAVEALDSPNIIGWVIVEYLDQRIGLELISKALGRPATRVERFDSFTREDLTKLEVLCKLAAAFSEVYQPRHVLRNWLIGSCTQLDEVAPIEFLAAAEGGMTVTRLRLIKAAREFVTSPDD